MLRYFVLSAAIVLAVLQASPSAVAWDGTDAETGNSVQIERGQTVRQGREVEYFDYGSGSYKTLDVDSLRGYGRGVEIEGTDSDGNSVTLEMDRNDE